MYSYEEQCIMDLADNFTLLYSFLGRSLIDVFGVTGEKALREGTRTRELFRALGRYGVAVYEQHYAALRSAGDIEELDGDTAVLRSEALYDAHTGLSLKADFGKAEFV